MAVRLIDIAKKTGVSFGAVSQVLRNPEHPRFSQETREKVLSTASQMGYRPNRVASGLRTGRTGVISLIIPWNAPEILDTAQSQASAAGLRLMIQLTPKPDLESERRALQAAIDWRVDGLIWMPFGRRSNYKDLVQQLRRARIQVSLYGRPVGQLPEAYTVLEGYAKGVRSIVDHLIDQGYRDIVYLMPASGNFEDRRYRRLALQAYTAEKGVSYRILWTESRTDTSAVREYVLKAKEPVGVICDRDLSIIRIVEMAEQMKIDIPSQMGLVGIGDMVLGGDRHIGEITRPRITMLYRPHGRMTELATRAIIGQIQAMESGEPYADARFDERRRYVTEMPLICRDSTRLRG